MATPTLTQVVSPEIYLYEDVDAVNGVTAQQDAQAQIREICDWMNKTYNPTWQANAEPGDTTQNVSQAGTIDPQIGPPTRRFNALTCMEAIKAVLAGAAVMVPGGLVSASPSGGCGKQSGQRHSGCRFSPADRSAL